jgi:hypothetical membrane protein
MEPLSLIANLAIISGVLSVGCLFILHLVSPEFKPSWRMISEYALGKHKWLITLFFLFWALCAVLAAYLLWNLVSATWAKIGVALVFISGIGALMGALFDVKHKHHGLAFLLGVPTLPIGALIVSYHLARQNNWSDYETPVLLSAHAVWISLIVMAVSMMILFSGFKKAGVAFGPNVQPPEKLPSGVIGINGYANRILVLCYIGWLVLIAYAYLSIN